MGFSETYAGVLAVIAELAQAQDDGRTDDIVARYHPDGAIEVPGVLTANGHAEIRAAYARPKWQPERGKPQQHLVTNTRVVRWSEDSAATVSDVSFVKYDGGRWPIQAIARYHDEFVRVEGAWLVLRRVDEFFVPSP